jgi:class 3 adenylate cyclase/tetratricopeptide (TPR) repeat protein
VTCSDCGTENAPDARFCKQCGARLGLTCSNCGLPLLPDARFCSSCGTPTSIAPGPAQGRFAPAGPPPTPAPAPVAERRLVSILFADLVGFTTLAEGRDAEDTRELLSRYFDLGREVIERYGGTVEKFIGDAVMAVWGAPTAREDDAELAVRAALELVESVHTLGPSLSARAGVLTGEAAVTLGAVGQGMVAGDLVNTASRLQSVARPGTVLVGEATQRAASKAIAFEPAGEQALKGKAAPVPAWQAVRVVAERGGRNRSETLEAPFVGRQDELRLLKELFHATGREGRSRLVSVIGPAGIGKTRLAWEFLKYVDGLLEGIWWHEGRCPAYGEGISFWALGEMVRQRCGLLESDDEPTTRAKVAETVRRFVPDADERRWIEPALLALLGLEARVASEQLFGAWRTFFERLAAESPVAMVFEDFHHADSGLIDFVDHMMEWSRNVPIFLMTLSRPDLLDKRPDWGAGKRNFTSVYLEPLPERAMRDLLAGLVPGLPDEAARSIVARADGVPLYAVETVRMLVAEGRLTLRDNVYVPTGDLATLAVPETLTALIAARLDGLEAADRGLVHDAAVLGQSFSPAALAAVSAVSATELEPRLRGLVRREILALDVDPRSPERGQYRFVQALIREVAYNTLAKPDRKARHLAAARHFEALGSDELAGALAGHYLAAWQNAPAGAEVDALAAQARIALSAAADRALALGAFDQAVSFFRQAILVTADPAEEATLLERASHAASQAAHHDQAEALARRALQVRRELGDRPGIARATAALGESLVGSYRVESAFEVLEPVVAELADLADEPVVIELEALLARAYNVGERGGRAIEVANRVLVRAERLDLVPLICLALASKGSALMNSGHNYEGMNTLRGVIGLAESRGLAEIAMRARISLAAGLGHRDPVEALAMDRALLEESRRAGLRAQAITAVGNGAEAARTVGDWDWAETETGALLASDIDREDRIWLLAQALIIGRLRGEARADAQAEFESAAAPVAEQAVQQTDIRDLEAWSALIEGRLQEASRNWESTAAASPLNAPSALSLAGRARLWDGDVAGARAALDAGDATSVHGPFVEARRMALAAGIAALEGREGEAIALYGRARDAMREAKVMFELALVGLDMAVLLDPALPAVESAIQESRQILGRLRAGPVLAMLDSALDGSLRPLPRIDAPSGSPRERGAGSSRRVAKSNEARA